MPLRVENCSALVASLACGDLKCPSDDKIDLPLSGGMCLLNTFLLDFLKSFSFQEVIPDT